MTHKEHGRVHDGHPARVLAEHHVGVLVPRKAVVLKLGRVVVEAAINPHGRVVAVVPLRIKGREV